MCDVSEVSSIDVLSISTATGHSPPCGRGWARLDEAGRGWAVSVRVLYGWARALGGGWMGEVGRADHTARVVVPDTRVWRLDMACLVLPMPIRGAGVIIFSVSGLHSEHHTPVT